MSIAFRHSLAMDAIVVRVTPDVSISVCSKALEESLIIFQHGEGLFPVLGFYYLSANSQCCYSQTSRRDFSFVLSGLATLPDLSPLDFS
jgi:hypothetical protein